jgi:hypothetical protein
MDVDMVMDMDMDRNMGTDMDMGVDIDRYTYERKILDFGYDTALKSEKETVNYRAIPLRSAFPFLHSLLLPIRPPLLTWNPPCCDRIHPPRSQVAHKLIFPFPSLCSYTPHSKIPTPRGFPDPNIHSLG